MDLNKDIEKKKIEIISERTNYNDIEKLVNSLIDDGKDHLHNNGGFYQLSVLNSIINLKNKSKDIMLHNNNNDNLKLHDFDTFLDIAMIISINYFKALLDKNNRFNDDDKKNKEVIDKIFINTYNKYKKLGIINILIGDKNIDLFEKHLKDSTNVNLSSNVDNVNMESYLITKLSKNKLISIVDIHNLRKTMLFSFNKLENKPFFNFYYNNFKQIAIFLEENKKLVYLVPHIKLCVKYSKESKFDKAFNLYINMCIEAVNMCSNLGFKINFVFNNNLLNDLPKPNNLFINNMLKNSIIYSF